VNVQKIQESVSPIVAAKPLPPKIPNVVFRLGEKELSQAYQRVRKANKLHRESGLEFGRLCYAWREQHRKQGARNDQDTPNDQGFEALLRKLRIPKTSAYRWIGRYEEEESKNAPRTTWHEVGTNPQKQRKPKSPPEGNSIRLEGDLPPGYKRQQWEDDVKLLGGYKKVGEMFFSFVRETAIEERERRAHLSQENVH
jgi:hypothetical protein